MMNSSVSSKEYKLTYFNERALAEPIRFIFAYAKVSYEDIRLERCNWEEKKFGYPWGVLPLLEIDGNKISQSRAILRYLGNIFNLSGDNEFENGKCDEMIEVMADFGNAILPAIYETDETKKKELTEKVIDDIFPKYFSKWNEILKQNNGFLVGNRLSYADFCFASFLEIFNEIFGGNILDDYIDLKSHKEFVFNSPGIKEWVEKRPKTET